MVDTTTNLTTQYQSGRPGGITLIGIHTMECDEDDNVANAVANYFKTVEASAHWCVDNAHRVRVVYDEDTAWTMPPTNGYSLNVEMAGYAAQTPAEWKDTYSQSTLDNAALCVAEWCKKYDIPIRRLTDDQIRSQAKGLAGHVDVNRVFADSTHYDPGPDFPWDGFLERVTVHFNALGGSTAPVKPVSAKKPDCTAFQRALRCPADNVWGPETDKYATALISATTYGGVKFPSGVEFTQGIVGTIKDGDWGPTSRLLLARTTVMVQRALKTMGFDPKGTDGIWGPDTNAAYSAATIACHI